MTTKMHMPTAIQTAMPLNKLQSVCRQTVDAIRNDIVRDLICRGFDPSSANILVDIAQKNGIIESIISGYNKNIPEFSRIRHFDFGVTDRCNLRCTYCLADSNSQSDDMSIEMFRTAVDVLLPSSCTSEPLFVFRGGEPLLMEIDWFESAVDYIWSCCRELKKHPKILIVTNAVLINKKWIEFFKRAHVSICPSIDGPPEINDRSRGCGEILIRNIRLLQEHGIGGNAGISVITKHNYDKMSQILHFFNELRLYSVKFNPVMSIGRGKNLEPLDGHEIFKAKSDLFKTSLEMKGKVLDEQIGLYLRLFFTQQESRPASICNSYYCGAGRLMIHISPRGDIFPCDREPDKMKPLGHVLHPFRTRLFKKNLDQFHRKGVDFEECFYCPARRICQFGCTSYHNLTGKRDRYECTATLMLFQFLKDNVQEARKLLAYYLKKEL